MCVCVCVCVFLCVCVNGNSAAFGPTGYLWTAHSRKTLIPVFTTIILVWAGWSWGSMPNLNHKYWPQTLKTQHWVCWCEYLWVENDVWSDHSPGETKKRWENPWSEDESETGLYFSMEAHLSMNSLPGLGLPHSVWDGSPHLNIHILNRSWQYIGGFDDYQQDIFHIKKNYLVSRELWI